MALSQARSRQLGRQLAQGGGGSSPHVPVFGSIHLAVNTLTFGASAGSVIGALTCDNAFATLSLLDDAGGRVAISGGNLTVGATATADATSFNILVQAQIGIRTQVQSFVINVADAPITNITLSNASVPSASAADTTVGNLASVPSGATLTLTNTAGGKFKIVAGVLKTDTVATNKGTNPTETVTVHAVHGTASFSKDVIITIS